MPDVAVDPLLLVPRVALADALLVAGYFGLMALLPGIVLCRLGRWRVACPFERFALWAVLGALWSGLVWFALGLSRMPGWQAWHLPVVLGPPLVVMLIARRPRRSRRRSSVPAAAWAGVALIGVFVAWYLVRVASAVELDATGLRLYGAWFSDKLTNMSPAAALLQEVPPRSLRMAGAPFPYHFFPHVFVGSAAWRTGVDYVNVFWFHAAALGIVVTSCAVLAVGRRVLGSYGRACVALALVGLTLFTTELRPLDLSIPQLLLGLLAMERWRRSGRARWAALAAVLWGTMPLYELFHAATLLAALGLWWAVQVVRRRGDWGAVARLTILVAATGGIALGAVKITMCSASTVAPTRFLVKSSYRDSYKNHWMQVVRGGGHSGAVLSTLLAWKRGEMTLTPPGQTPPIDGPRPGWLRRVAANVAFEVGFLGYVFVRFINLAVAGVVVLVWAGRRRRDKTQPPIAAQRWLRPPPTVLGLIAAVAGVGFGLPLILTWGHDAGGQWWETPNIYRPTTLAHLLLCLIGVAALGAALRRRNWAGGLLLALAGWQAWTLLSAAVATPADFHHVPYDRLQALAFLRAKVPFGDVVIHPWIDDLIRRRDAPEAVAWVYKRHFTLGSGLAGQRMWYEGREDHLFIGGFIAPEPVYRRSRLRREFYTAPTPEVIEEVVGRGQVQWVVADRQSPAPETIVRNWPIAFANSTVTVYHAP